MKNLFLWYIPQAGLVLWGYWFASEIEPPLGGQGKFIFALMLAAAYTGGVNLIMTIWRRVTGLMQRSPAGQAPEAEVLPPERARSRSLPSRAGGRQAAP